MKYIGIYADSDGETHFEDVEEETRKIEIAPTAIFDIGQTRPASECFWAIPPAGHSADFHPPPKRFIVPILAGEMEITVSDGEVRRFKAGDIVLLDDVASKGHKSVVVSQTALHSFLVGLPE